VEIKRIMVIGAGFMGSGIAQVMAAAGYNVVLMDVADGFVRKGMAAIEKNLAGSVAKGKLAEADKTATWVAKRARGGTTIRAGRKNRGRTSIYRKYH
jgi:3-hydroxybutyryl-CoA dehydrogenase